MNLNGYGKLIKKDRVSGFEKFAFGMGEISTNIVFTIATSLLTMFYTDVAHVSAAVIGMIIAVSQIFNGISDITAGFIVDRTRSKYGRARVWMLRVHSVCDCGSAADDSPPARWPVRTGHLCVRHL